MIPIPNTTEVMISRIAMSTPATATPVSETIHNSTCYMYTIQYCIHLLCFFKSTVVVVSSSIVDDVEGCIAFSKNN